MSVKSAVGINFPGQLISAGLLVVCFAGALRADDDYFAQRLERYDIEPTAEGARQFLRSLVISGGKEKTVQRLIAQLGDPKYKNRQDAMVELQRLPVPPVLSLEKAMDSPDAEIRARVKRLLIIAKRQNYQGRLSAALQYLEHQKVSGCVDVLLVLMAELRQDYLVDQARAAIRATACLEDADRLRSAIRSDRFPAAEAAALALADVLGDKVAEEIRPLLKSPRPTMQLAAAESLANLGDHDPLPILISLLKAEDFSVRHRSITVLRSITGQQFGYSANADEELRKSIIDSWESWHRESGATAKLTFPIPQSSPETGRTLVCVWGENTLREYSLENDQLFAVPGFKYVWGCHATASGRRLVVDATRNLLLEFDKAGKEVWRKENLPERPTCVQGLPNGNVLVSCSDADRVIEIDPQGKIVWDFSVDGRPTTAQRLSNGSTVVNLQNAGRVIEVDPQGNVTTLLTGLARVHTTQSLDNGNLLTTDMSQNRVDEYDREGRVVWSVAGLNNPAQAQRLANGNTLIADEAGIREYTPDKNVVWSLSVSRSRFHRF